VVAAVTAAVAAISEIPIAGMSEQLLQAHVQNFYAHLLAISFTSRNPGACLLNIQILKHLQ